MREYIKRKKAALKAETPSIGGVDIIRPGGLRTGDPGASPRVGSFGHINWEQFELNTGQRGRLLRTQPMSAFDE